MNKLKFFVVVLYSDRIQVESAKILSLSGELITRPDSREKGMFARRRFPTVSQNSSASRATSDAALGNSIYFSPFPLSSFNTTNIVI